MRIASLRAENLPALMVIITASATFASGANLHEQRSVGTEASCVGNCFSEVSSTLTCQCDDLCSTRRDCCDDYVSSCLENSQTSCYGRCFNPYGFIPDQECYCDDHCEEWFNCCDDYVEQCANESLCQNRCFAAINPDLPCQCDASCRDNDNCCPDYQSQCLPASCHERCGERNDKFTCQCDQGCIEKEDCCPDYVGNCTTEGSCYYLCGYDADPERSCQCDENCQTNCCEDYKAQCQEPYLCKGDCNVVKEACSCMEDCQELKTCCTDYAQSCLGDTAWVEDECTPESEMVCPEGFDKPPIILFSIDGFRNSYLYRDITPNLLKMAKCGVHSPYVRSVYPTKTFPNHYTVVTGLYPESHGIVANTFYDHDLDDEFSIGSSQSSDPHWWGGEPIWVTARKQGLISASYFWVGSDVNITMYPTYYFPFDSSVPDEKRVYTALSWMDNIKSHRPAIITMYIEEVDGAGHRGGPDGDEVNTEISRADNIIGMLMDGLKARKLDKCVDVMVLADHGMDNIDCEQLTYVDKYGVDVDTVYFRGGPGGRIGKSTDESEWPLFDPYDIKDKLQCKRDETHFQTFIKYEYLPKRLHYAYNDRIDDVIVLSDDEWLLGGETGSYKYCNGGTHGWDNENKQMRALFVGHGASLKRGYNTTEAFDNFEIYNMLCDLLEISPAPNNGTEGTLNHIVRNPKPYSRTKSNVQPTTCPYPTNTDVAADDLGCADCGSESQSNQLLDLTSDQETASQNFNLLMGTPEISPVAEGETVNFCLLTQSDYVTAYNLLKKMPYYSSFSLKKADRTFSESANCLRPDIRLDTQASCDIFGNNPDISPGFLFHPGFLTSDESRATILSNVIPVYNAFVPIWEQFSMSIDNWAGLYSEVNVILGPVFDYNFDGKADSLEVIQQYGSYMIDGDKTAPPIPTHIFVMATKCRDEFSNEGLTSCSASPNKIEVLSFVIPNYKEQPCTYDLEREDWVSQTIYEHVARVRDIEFLTGISFFPNWFSNTEEATKINALRLKVHLPEFGSPWLEDFYLNKKPNHGSAPHSMTLLVLFSTFAGFLMKNL